MALEITGVVELVLDAQTGQGKKGPWRKQSFVIEVPGQFPRKVIFEAWNDTSDVVASLRNQEKVTVSFEPESREFNGKWYTSLKAWKIQRQGSSGQAPAPTAQPASMPVPEIVPPPVNDDLPF